MATTSATSEPDGTEVALESTFNVFNDNLSYCDQNWTI